MPDEGTHRTAVTAQRRPGRQPATSRAQIEHAAFELFEAKGFADTTVDDIAAAAGIGRRTSFRYFGSKRTTSHGDRSRRSSR